MKLQSNLNFDTVFLSNSGAETIENAIKICYSTQQGRGYGICFRGAFHGRTLGALSLNRSKKQHRAYYPQLPGIIELPYCRCEGDCQCEWLVKGPDGKLVSALQRLLDPENGLVYPEEVAYIIFEPIQGEGGYRFPNPKFVQEISSIARKNNIPLISDEVQMGLGRTGKWWAIEHYGVKPDLLTAAKSLQVGATIGRKKYFPKEPLRIAGTWCEGNAMASAVGYTTINIMQRDKLLKNATQKGKYLLDGLKQLQKKYSKLTDARGIGLAVAIDFQNKKMRHNFKLKAFEKWFTTIKLWSYLGKNFTTTRCAEART